METNKGGAPVGNTNAFKGRPASNALHMLIEHGGEPKKVAKNMQALYDCWKAQLDKAKNGDNGSMDMIVSRLEGRPAQSVILSGDEDNPINFVNQITRVIVDPAKPVESGDTNDTDS